MNDHVSVKISVTDQRILLVNFVVSRNPVGQVKVATSCQGQLYQAGITGRKDRMQASKRRGKSGHAPKHSHRYSLIIPLRTIISA